MNKINRKERRDRKEYASLRGQTGTSKVTRACGSKLEPHPNAITAFGRYSYNCQPLLIILCAFINYALDCDR